MMMQTGRESNARWLCGAVERSAVSRFGKVHPA
jgi:hypothetical protein